MDSGVRKHCLVRDTYVRARRRVPDVLVNTLKRSDLLLRIARRLQPPKEYPQVYRLEGPLKGHLMRIPEPDIYPMAWGSYEPDVCRVMEDIVECGWTVLDIGAHIGYHTLLLAKLVGDNGKIISFEPLPESQEFLRENVLLNGYQETVHIEPIAVAERTCLTRLHHLTDRSQAFLDGCAQDVTDHGDTVVPACSLDDYFRLLDWPAVHFIKMDIEGAESRAIKGMLEVIDRNRPVFMIESHGEQAREGLSILIENDYELLSIDPQHGPIPCDLESGNLFNEHWLLLP